MTMPSFRLLTVAEALWAFVDVQQVAHAVAGAAAVVDAQIPQVAAGQNVQITAGSTLFEFYRGQGDDAFQHQSEVPAFLVGDLAQSDGSGGVGGAMEILAAAVVEEQVAALDLFGGVRLRSVVHHSGVLAVADDGGKAVALEFRLLLTEGQELLGQGPLGVFLTCGHFFCQPAVEFNFGYAVVDVRLEGVLVFHVVFAGLHQRNWVGLVHNGQICVAGSGFVQVEVCFGLVANDGQLLVHCGQVGEDGLVWADLDTVFSQSGFYFSRNAAVLGVENGFVLRNKGVGDNNRVAGNVGGTDVHQPCNVVQPADDESVGLVVLQGFADVSQLVRGGFTGVFQTKVVNFGQALPVDGLPKRRWRSRRGCGW